MRRQLHTTGSALRRTAREAPIPRTLQAFLVDTYLGYTTEIMVQFTDPRIGVRGTVAKARLRPGVVLPSIPAGSPVSVIVNHGQVEVVGISANASGEGASAGVTDHTHAATGSGANGGGSTLSPGTLNIPASSFAAPGAVGTANAAGSADTASRSDHGHKLLGPAIQAARSAGTVVAAGGGADATITWPTAFADTNYSVGLSIREDGVGSASQCQASIQTKAAGSISVRLRNDHTSSHTLIVEAVAVHD